MHDAQVRIREPGRVVYVRKLARKGENGADFGRPDDMVYIRWARESADMRGGRREGFSNLTDCGRTPCIQRRSYRTVTLSNMANSSR